MRLANLFFILCLCSAGAVVKAESSAELAEVWEASRVFNQSVSGPLSIKILNGEADGHIKNLRAHSAIKDGWFTLNFGSENGRFKGRIANNKKVLEGHWIQPASGNRVFVPYATPVRFTLRDDVFEGHVEALENRMTQYLLLGENTKNGRQMTFINPEQNLGRLLKSALLQIENDDANVMGQLRWQKKMQEFATGRIDKENQVLSLYIPFFGGSYDFKPAGKNSTYWAKGKGNHYRYRQPDAVMGDWPTSTPEDVGVSRENLIALVQQIIDKPVVDTSQGSVHAVLVARQGKLILEEYFSGFDRTSLHDTRSASKSLTGSLVGLAQQAGVPIQLEDQLYSVMANRYPEMKYAGQKSEINLRHVLSMSTGLDCDDNDDESPGHEDRMQNQQQENDWFRYLLKLDVVNKPGTKPAYCSAGMNMAGAMLAEKSGEWLPTNIEKHFAKPLGIHRYHINMMPEHPLRGENEERFGPRFVDMSEPYNKKMISLMKSVAFDLKIDVKEGIYLALQGPTFETPAEYRMVKLMGADAVGMSTVPEVIVAKHMGMDCFGLSVITDLGIEGKVEEVSHEAVQVAAKSSEITISKLVEAFVGKL